MPGPGPARARQNSLKSSKTKENDPCTEHPCAGCLGDPTEGRVSRYKMLCKHSVPSARTGHTAGCGEGGWAKRNACSKAAQSDRRATPCAWLYAAALVSPGITVWVFAARQGERQSPLVSRAAVRATAPVESLGMHIKFRAELRGAVFKCILVGAPIPYAVPQNQGVRGGPRPLPRTPSFTAELVPRTGHTHTHARTHARTHTCVLCEFRAQRSMSLCRLSSATEATRRLHPFL